MPAEHTWAAYARTVVELIGPRGDTVVVRPARRGEAGPWPWLSPETVHVLTAWDPGDERPNEAVNRARQSTLEAELRPLALRMWRTVGLDPVTGHRDEGIAVSGAAEADVLGAGGRYGQDAIFRWTPEAWVIVSCQGDWRMALGWTVTIRPPPAVPRAAR